MLLPDRVKSCSLSCIYRKKMSKADQKRFRLKYWVAHSALLSAIWRWMKRK